MTQREVHSPEQELLFPWRRAGKALPEGEYGRIQPLYTLHYETQQRQGRACKHQARAVTWSAR